MTDEEITTKRHGNVLGFMCGELVAAALQGNEDPLLELFAPARLLASG